MSQHVELIESDSSHSSQEFVLLTPRYTPARTGPTFHQFHNTGLYEVISSTYSSQYLVLDLETEGNDASLSTTRIISIGLAWDKGSCYIPFAELSTLVQDYVLELIYRHPRLVAHNIYFDGAVLYARMGRHPNWYICTLAAYRHIANEGWAGQRHGLKQAQIDVLQWTETNETELDIWLVRNRYFRGVRSEETTADELEEQYRAGGLHPEKSEMWRAPVEILGKYCILDAESTYLLLTEHFIPVLNQFETLNKFLTTEFLGHILLHIEQKMHGIEMDRDGLEKRAQYLRLEIEKLSGQFLCHVDVAQHIRDMELEMLHELKEKEPHKWNKQDPRPVEPPRLKKDGTVSKNWEKWVQNESKYTVPVMNGNWAKWEERWNRAVNGLDPDYRFNPNSGDQLRELFYQRCSYPVTELTDGGEAGIGTSSLSKCGEAGQLLVSRAYLNKELSYIDKYLELTEHRSTLHPSFNMPGTSTGRLSSKEPNLQQVPKSKAVMSLFKSRPGTVWVDLDFAALEPVVTTEFSQDENMLFIYGNGAPLNDIYLYVGASISGEIGIKIRATGYDPRNPTKEAISRAKKECKHERQICKSVVLACAYGAGVGKITETLEADGIFMSEEEVRVIWETYWDVFSGVKQFGRDLEFQWKQNGGYILNGLGRPMCVTPDYRKDLLNRFIQSTGHDLLVKYVQIYTEELNRRQIPWAPNILDFHDSSAVEVPERYGKEVAEILSWAVTELNNQLGGTVSLRGTPMIGRNLAETKEAET